MYQCVGYVMSLRSNFNKSLKQIESSHCYWLAAEDVSVTVVIAVSVSL